MKNLTQQLDKYFFWVLMFLAVFIPLYPKFPLFNIPLTYVAVRLEDLIIATVVSIWLFTHIFNYKNYLNQTIYKSFILFWIIGGLSLISALLITYSISPHLGLLHWLRRIEYMSLFIIAATTITKTWQVKVSLAVIFTTAILVAMYGFGQILFDFPVISTTNKEFSKGLVLFLTNGARVNSTFAGHYDLAAYLSIILVLIATLFFYYKNLLHKFLLIALGAVCFVLLGLTAARISFFATFLGIAATFLLGGKKWLLVGLIGASLLLVVAIPDLRHRLVATITVNIMGGGGAKYTPPPDKVTIFTPKKAVPSIDGSGQVATSQATESGAVAVDTVPGEPINTTELGVYRSWGIRFDVEWPRAWAAFLKNPFLGTGYSSLTIATDSDYLRSLGEVGILGTLALILIFIIIIKKMIIFLRGNTNFEKYFIIGGLGTVLVILTSGLFIDVLELKTRFWQNVKSNTCWLRMEN